ncbi:hypothetical protein ACS127_09600 [Amphibacillus sp. Q70]|uniref:hypothetical protein n=1 Tax=Amphibacillus sp. Q70 TaxID=3453416 RepID=UPI003F876940
MVEDHDLSLSSGNENTNLTDIIIDKILPFSTKQRKGWYGLIILSLFLLIGCQSEASVPDGYYTYEKEEVEAAVRQVTFNPEVPEYVPIPVEFIISDPYLIVETDEEALDISFYSRENDLLTYQVTEGIFELGEMAEDIKIDSSTSAHYHDNGFAKMLTWEKNGLSYKLEFRSSIIGDDNPSRPVSKEELVKVAQSCQS